MTNIRPGQIVRVAPNSPSPWHGNVGTVLEIARRDRMGMDLDARVVFADGNSDGITCEWVPLTSLEILAENGVAYANKRLAEYKRVVHDVAIRTANEHNMCGVVEDALREIDALPVIDVTFTLQVNVPVTQTSDNRGARTDADIIAELRTHADGNVISVDVDELIDTDYWNADNDDVTVTVQDVTISRN